MNRLEELLTKKKMDNGDSPLFNKPVEIVRSILDHPKSPLHISKEHKDYERKFNNIKVYLSQVLKGKRTASEDLILALKTVISEKLSLVDDLSITNEIEEQIDKLKNRIYPTPDIDKELDELNSRIRTAKTQIIFTSRPVETYDYEKAQTITESFLQNLGLLDDSFDASKLYKYFEYYFPQEGIALEFFERLYRNVKRKTKLPDAEIFERFEQINSTSLKVYIVDGINCVFPHSVFNYDSTNPGGFVLFAQDETNFSIAKMSPAGLHRWYNTLYINAKMNRKEVSFKDIKNQIKR